MMKHIRVSEPIAGPWKPAPELLGLDDAINKALAEGWEVAHITTVLSDIEVIMPPSRSKALIHTLFLSKDS